MKTAFSATAVLCAFSVSCFFAGSAAAEASAGKTERRAVDMAICLDVSGSMQGLIDSAKQRLWDVVSELARAKPTPRLRVAIFSYGSPGYGTAEGYVRKNLDLTEDLDKVNQVLFGFTTNGGEEYVARVISKAADQLDWSPEHGALKLMFVAGNEPADQDREIDFRTSAKKAVSKGIQVNTIYCGAETDSDAALWRETARLADGRFASINQSAAAVAIAATPMDDELLSLNTALNKTYLAYGAEGQAALLNQAAQDANAAKMSKQAAVSRVAVKGGRLYSAANWDVVDAVSRGKKLEEIPRAELPQPMKEMNLEQQKQFVEKTATERQALQISIQNLEQKRRQYIAEQQKPAGAGDGLDEALKRIIRAQSEAKGFQF